MLEGNSDRSSWGFIALGIAGGAFLLLKKFFPELITILTEKVKAFAS